MLRLKTDNGLVADSIRTVQLALLATGAACGSCKLHPLAADKETSRPEFLSADGAAKQNSINVFRGFCVHDL